MEYYGSMASSKFESISKVLERMSTSDFCLLFCSPEKEKNDENQRTWYYCRVLRGAEQLVTSYSKRTGDYRFTVTTVKPH